MAFIDKYEYREVTVRKCSIGGTDIEFGAYDNHVHNEEVYHHLCSVKKRNTLLSLTQVEFIFNYFIMFYFFF